MLALKKASFLFYAHFSFEAGFSYAAIAELITALPAIPGNS